ncbi:MAG: heavy-metal-associated domain-containing protein [Burkholderiales bacterium]
MKTIYIITCLLFFSTLISLAQSDKIVKTEITVYGNCGMCKMRIQKALDRTGVKTSNWDVDSKKLSVVYNSSKISEQKIHQYIANVGHDTDKVKAKEETYAKLPFCCLYRDHDHSGMHDDGN